MNHIISCAFLLTLSSYQGLTLLLLQDGGTASGAFGVKVGQNGQARLPGTKTLGGVHLEAQVQALFSHLFVDLLVAVEGQLPAAGIVVEHGQQLQRIGEQSLFGALYLLVPGLVAVRFAGIQLEGRGVDADMPQCAVTVAIAAAPDITGTAGRNCSETSCDSA